MNNSHKMVPTLPGFEHVKRYWDSVRKVVAAKILPGEYYVTRHVEGITTVLGSCISACIRDPVAKVGGMNHFMLPSGRDLGNSQAITSATRYGNYAMEHLINDILKYGGRRERLEVKVFGGGKVIQDMVTMNIGERNIQFVDEYLQVEGLTILAHDVGDIYPRKVLYFPETGVVKVKKLKTLHNNVLEQRETRYFKQISDAPVTSDVELF